MTPSSRARATWASLFFFTGCAALLPAPTPMAAVHDALPGGGAKCLVVFLPGVGDSAADFTRYGFVEALRQRGLSVDVVAANATRGYWKSVV